MNDYLPVSTQLNILFENVLGEAKRPYTLQEVSDGTGISVSSLSQLRNGHIENPQLNTLRELCQFFGVPLRYFETKDEKECFAIIADDNEGNAPELNEIAFRATNLSENGQRDVLTIIKWVQAAEAQRKQGLDLPPLPHLNNDDQ